MNDPFIESLARGAIFALVVFVMYLCIRAIKGAYRRLRGISTESIAHAAGRASALAERKAVEAAKAFKQGRGK